LRKRWGLSQIELAEKLGVSFQQVQKYEKGVTRISVERLKDISDALGVDISVFFKEEPYLIQESQTPYGRTLLSPVDDEELKVLKLFRKVRNPYLRRGIINLIRGAISLEKSLEAKDVS
jgi:transcriptional regulator with XRE-family HTH domain